MGHIGGELPAQLLRPELLRHIEQQQHHAGDGPLVDHGAGIQLIFPVGQRHHRLRPLPIQRLEQQLLEPQILVVGQDIRPHAPVAQAQDLPGRRIQDQDLTAVVQQHKPLAHTGSDGIEFIFPMDQVPGLDPHLPLLGIQPPQQRGQLPITAIGHGILQIQLVQRLHDRSGQPTGQERRQHQRHRDHHTDRLRHGKDQVQHGVLGHGQPDHRPVRQSLGAVKIALRQGHRVPGALTVAAFQRLPDLLPLQMVLHPLRLHVVVIQHGPIRPDPGDPAIRYLQPIEVSHALMGRRLGSQQGLVLQLFLLDLGVVAVQQPHDRREGRQQHRQRHQQYGPKDPLGHSVFSIR